MNPPPLPPAPPPYFFAVSVAKFAVMSVATAGLYQLYWFYKHWQVIRARTGERLSPVLRALFNVFFVYPLFRRVAEETPPGQVSPLLLAIVFIAVGVASLLPLSEPWSFVGLFSVLPLLEVQSQANLANLRRTPEAPRNSSLTWTNLVGLAACAALWTLVIGGLVESRRDPGSPVSLKVLALNTQMGLPRSVETGVELVRVTDEPRQLTYSYRAADGAAERLRTGQVRDETRRARVAEACRQQELRRLLDAAVTLRHVYRTRSGDLLLTFAVTRADCGTQAPAGPPAGRGLVPV
jgi:hypothetical protein